MIRDQWATGFGKVKRDSPRDKIVSGPVDVQSIIRKEAERIGRGVSYKTLSSKSGRLSNCLKRMGRMKLRDDQKDALGELINIGFGQAAYALARIVEQRVILEAPDINIVPLRELGNTLEDMGDERLLTIHQLFSGKLSGDMMLLFDLDSALKLTRLLNNKYQRKIEKFPDTLEASAFDSLSEIGNILLSAFAGSFGNLLHIQISFAVPQLHKVSLLSMLESLVVGENEIRYALVVKIFFRLVEDDVQSHMLIVMGIHSLENLFQAMVEEGFLRAS
jgi:chemotaxis protein CheC